MKISIKMSLAYVRDSSSTRTCGVEDKIKKKKIANLSGKSRAAVISETENWRNAAPALGKGTSIGRAKKALVGAVLIKGGNTEEGTEDAERLR